MHYNAYTVRFIKPYRDPVDKMHLISVRFYEMGDISIQNGLNTQIWEKNPKLNGILPKYEFLRFCIFFLLNKTHNVVADRGLTLPPVTNISIFFYWSLPVTSCCLVVGGGSSGCVVASRLVETAKSILLLGKDLCLKISSIHMLYFSLFLFFFLGISSNIDLIWYYRLFFTFWNSFYFLVARSHIKFF